MRKTYDWTRELMEGKVIRIFNPHANRSWYYCRNEYNSKKLEPRFVPESTIAKRNESILWHRVASGWNSLAEEELFEILDRSVWLNQIAEEKHKLRYVATPEEFEALSHKTKTA